MTPASAFGLLLPLLAPGLTVSAAIAALSTRTRWLTAILIALAFFSDLALSISAATVNATLGTDKAALFTWSPLGLYGVGVLVRRSAHVALLTCPVLLLAWCGWMLAERRRRWFSGLAEDPPSARAYACASLLALSGGIWAVRAGDFVSLYFGVSLYFLCSAAVVMRAAGIAAAGRRLVVAYLCLAALLTSGLLLGKVNGHFELAGLSSAALTDVAFGGLALSAVVAASVPPFHGWLLRSGRNALVPAIATVGGGIAVTLLLTAFVTTDLEVAGQGQLRGIGWIAALFGTAIAITRPRPTIALGAAWLARGGALFLAGSVSTAGSLAGWLAFAAIPMTAVSLLWLTAAAPWGGHLRARGPAAPALRTPGFWINLLILATAAGLPPTIGGTLRAAFAGALTSWPSGDELLRVPLVLADAATLIAGSSLLWEPRYLPPLRGTRGWLVAAALGVALCLPAALPQFLIDPWLGPASAAAVGTSTSPLPLRGAGLPNWPSLALALVGAWALAQRLRGKEWLPPLLLALLGALALGWTGLRKRWRGRGLSRAPATATEGVWQHAQRAAERATLILRPFEERYYAGAAILLAVAIIFVVGR